MAGKKNDNYQAEIYTIQKGDSVYGIADKIGIPYKRMLEANPALTHPEKIFIGQQIWIPLKGVHTMQKGDTFFSLARHYGVSQKDLERVNPDLKDMKKIDLGEQIRIPYSLAALKTTSVRTLEAEYEKAASPPPPQKAAPAPVSASKPTPKSTFTSASSPAAASTPVSTPAAARASAPPPASSASTPAAHPDSPVFRRTPLQPASPDSQSYNIPAGATKKAWSVVEGAGVSSTFQSATKDKRPLVVIDPGHGAYRDKNSPLDKGHGPVNGLHEYEIIDPVAVALGEKLRDAGYRVAFTRNPGEIYRYEGKDRPADPAAPPGSLASRSRFAHALAGQLDAPCIFVSLHANSGPTTARGMEILVDRSISGRGGMNDLSTATSPQSCALANCVSNKIGTYGNIPIRGIVPQNVMVLNTMEEKSGGHKLNAAILIEMGFLTNTVVDTKKYPNARPDMEVLDYIRQNPHEYAGRIFQGIDAYVESHTLDSSPKTASLPTPPTTTI